MICNAILDDTIVLSLPNKGIYNHVAIFCKCWNVVVDICNGRDEPHSPDNAEQQQIASWKCFCVFPDGRNCTMSG
jgi:hypothetical protein